MDPPPLVALTMDTLGIPDHILKLHCGVRFIEHRNRDSVHAVVTVPRTHTLPLLSVPDPLLPVYKLG